MVRSACVADGGIAYHVLSRGVGRRTMFYRDADYSAFLRVIEDVRQQVAMTVIAYRRMSHRYRLEL